MILTAALAATLLSALAALVLFRHSSSRNVVWGNLPVGTSIRDGAGSAVRCVTTRTITSGSLAVDV